MTTQLDQRGLERLRQDILSRVRTLIHDADHAAAVDCAIERDGPRLVVHLSGPDLGCRTEKSMTVKVLDAIWRSDRTHGDVSVDYHVVDWSDVKP